MFATLLLVLNDKDIKLLQTEMHVFRRESNQLLCVE